MKFFTIIVFCVCFFAGSKLSYADWPNKAIYKVDGEWKKENPAVSEVGSCTENEDGVTQFVVSQIESVQTVGQKLKIKTKNGKKLNFAQAPGVAILNDPITDFGEIFKSEISFVFLDSESLNSQSAWDNIITVIGLRVGKEGKTILFFRHIYFPQAHNEFGYYKITFCSSDWEVEVKQQLKKKRKRRR